MFWFVILMKRLCAVAAFLLTRLMLELEEMPSDASELQIFKTPCFYNVGSETGMSQTTCHPGGGACESHLEIMSPNESC